MLVLTLSLVGVAPGPARAQVASSPPAASGVGPGYWLTAGDGGIFAFGDAPFAGSTGALRLNRPVVAMASTTTGRGYWLTGADGGIFAFGDAAFRGSTGAIRLNQPIVGMAATPSGQGYWLVASDGGIFAFGDAAFRGSTGAIRLNQPIVGMASTPSGGGYWLVASDGGIFAFGDAAFFGSTGTIRLNQPVVAMASSSSGRGYWLVASDGGIFAFGDAAFLGSTGAAKLNQPIVGMAPGPVGAGYWLVASDGGIFAFGDAPFFGSTGSMKLSRPVVGMTPSVRSYRNFVPPTTKVAPPEAVLSATGTPDGIQSVLLAGSTGGLTQRPSVGDVLVVGVSAATPEGLLGRVRLVSDDGGNLRIVTEPATLIDAVPEGSFDLVGDASGATRGVNTDFVGAQAITRPQPIVENISRNLSCGTGASVSVTGSLSVAPTFNFAATWGGWRAPHTVTYARVELSVIETAELRATAQAGASCKIAPVPLLARPIRLPAITFAIGPVPVVVLPELQFFLTAEGTLDANITAGVTQQLTAKAGLAYENGRTSPIRSLDNSFSHQAPSIDGGARLAVGVGPTVSLLLYGAGGPKVNIDASLALDARPQDTPWWTLTGRLQAGAGLTIPKLRFDRSDPAVIAFERELAHATAPFTPPPPDPTPTLTGVSAGTGDPSRYGISWTDNAVDETGWEITDGSLVEFHHVGPGLCPGCAYDPTTTGPGYSFPTHTSFPPGDSRCWQIRAVRPTGRTAWSNSLCASLP